MSDVLDAALGTAMALAGGASGSAAASGVSGASASGASASGASASEPEESTRALEEALEQWAVSTFSDEPFTKLIALVGIGSAIFYKAEVGKNPKVNSIYDALVYVSTCTSVGYGDIFAVTPVGKLVGTFVMTVGPAMANAALNGGQLAREREHQESQATQHKMLETMQEILAELKKRPG